jgi:membrane-associated phospholipid phosphatase
LIPFAFLSTGLLMLSIDVPVARYFKDKSLPESLDRPLREALENCETFGHGFGATLIIVAVAVLSPASRRDIPWVISGSLGAGAIANLLKLILRRIRPVHFDLSTRTVWNTFEKAYDGGNGMQSFPSAHTATAVGLAVVLSTLFPRGRWYFMTLAFLVGLQRVVSSAHFPSDVCAGATVGWIVGAACAMVMNRPNKVLATRDEADQR